MRIDGMENWSIFNILFIIQIQMLSTFPAFPAFYFFFTYFSVFSSHHLVKGVFISFNYSFLSFIFLSYLFFTPHFFVLPYLQLKTKNYVIFYFFYLYFLNPLQAEGVRKSSSSLNLFLLLSEAARHSNI